MSSLNLKTMLQWSGEITELSAAARSAAAAHGNASEFFQKLVAASTWTGYGGEAAKTGMTATANKHAGREEDWNKAAGSLDQIKTRADALAEKIKKIQRDAMANTPVAVEINDDTDEVIPPSTDHMSKDAASQLGQKVADLKSRIAAAHAEGSQIDADLARAIAAATDTQPPNIKDAPIGGIASTLGVVDASQPSQRDNQINAFKDVFGRVPTTPADWASAQALDPHSYDQKNNGQAPNIRTTRIDPHPGEGVVRTNLFIPGREAAYPSPTKGQGHNWGDNRGFDPGAAAEHSRVSVVVDYENGLVTVRQNPSVDSTTGQAMTGTPWASVAQLPDGSVGIRYNAADPFSPLGGQTTAKVMGYSVHGDLAIHPGGGSNPTIGGSITQFPAIEVYHDSPNGLTNTVFQNMPANTTSYGPMVGLLNTQPIGDQALAHLFDGANFTDMGTTNAIPVVHPATPPAPLGGGLPPLPPYPVK